jgi:carboxyl-terminal processing protease
VAIAVVTAACAGAAGPDTLGTTPSTAGPATTASRQEPTTPSTINPAAAEYVENFEFVWATVNEGFYDSDFGGVDWEAVHDRYLPQVTATDNDRTFLELMNTMVFELGVSHLFVLPPEAEFIDPVLTAEGELGIEVRLLDGEWVVTAVETGSPAAEAGLRPGYLVDSIAGQRVTDIAASGFTLPPLHERGIRSSQILAVEQLLHGEPGAVTTVGYRDAADEPQQVTLTFRQRGSSAELIPGFPPVFTTLEVDQLDGGIAYIRFDPFVLALTTPILQAIDAMRDAPGLILDVRGNHGGNSDVGKQLIGNLVDEPLLIWTWKLRNGSGNTYAEPSERPYDGPVVVLVDVLSGSAAEAFAGGLQAIGRAVIAGERTAGRLLGGEITQLPIGALMIYPINQPVAADGTIVEGRGVIPDLPVAVHRGDLLAGHDPALQAAIDHLLGSDD